MPSRVLVEVADFAPDYVKVVCDVAIARTAFVVGGGGMARGVGVVRR